MNDFQTTIAALIDTAQTLGADLISGWLLVQLIVIALGIAVSVALSTLVRRRIDLVSFTMGWPPMVRVLVRAMVENLGTIIFLVLMALTRATMMAATWPSRSYLIGVAASLATAWVAISLVTVLIRNQFVYRLVAFSAWTIAALSILGLLGPVVDALNSVGVIIGGLRVTPLLIIKTTVLLLIALWAAASVSNFVELRVRGASDLTPSVQVLVSKLIRVGFISFAILVVMSSVGIDLSALALVGGAVGVGIGFGLQKIVSNFVSGIILLVDKSIKPGDIVSLGDAIGTGIVVTMGARYTSIDTRDGREFLVPNEDFITQRVVNLSYSNERMQLKVTFGTSYESDPHRVIALALETVAGVARVLPDPAPFCILTGFGTSSLDFALQFWIGDPLQGTGNVRSDVMLALWDAFKREGIEIPYPVTDVRVNYTRVDDSSPSPVGIR